MTTPWKPPAAGALDDTAWPDKLVARAVEPGDADDRLHGYAVLGDLARHYEHSDLVYLAITGELPDERAARLFRVALASFAAISVAEAPVHVAVLGRICGGALASALGAGAIALADQARDIVERHAELLVWLGADGGDLPASARAVPASAWTASLCAAVPEAARITADMTLDAARIALLFEAGVCSPEQMQAAIVAGRFSGLVAEALAASPADLKLYPVKLPPFHYVEPH